MKNHDAGWREDRAAELAHQDLQRHFETACTCDACGDAREPGSFDDGEFALCKGCATRLACAFMPEILSAAQTRWA